MNSKYVVSLDLAKKLKEAGCVQESEWYWCEPFIADENGVMPTEPILYPNDEIIMQYVKKIASAFHSGELGEMLPWKIRKPRNNQEDQIGRLQVHKTSEDWIVEYHITFDPPVISIRGYTEAESRGLMLLYLKQNNLT